MDDIATKPDAQTHLDAARAHTAVAEKTYGDIAKEYDRLRASESNLSPREALNQSITNLYGDKAPEIAEQIARDADRMRIFNAGEEFVQAYTDLKKAGLNSVNNRLGKARTLLDDIKDTRNALTHPDQKIDKLPDADFPQAAETATKYIQQELETLRTTLVSSDKMAARDDGIQHLERMQQELGGFNKPGGYRLSQSGDLMPEDLAKATQMQEISAGTQVAITKSILKEEGQAFDTHTFRNAKEPMDVIPGTVPGEHPVDALHVRRDDLAHLDPKPEHPGALERARTGNYLSDQLPVDAYKITVLPQKFAHAANDPDFNVTERKVPSASGGAVELESAARAPELSNATPLKIAGVVAMAGLAMDGGQAANNSIKAGDGKVTATAKGLARINDDIQEMVLPHAHSGLDNILSKEGYTGLDRSLNMVDLSTRAASFSSPVAASVNFGANLAKAGVKLYGLGGQKQDGGYVYDTVDTTMQYVEGTELLLYRAGKIVGSKAYDAAVDGLRSLGIAGGGDVSNDLKTPSGSPNRMSTGLSKAH